MKRFAWGLGALLALTPLGAHAASETWTLEAALQHAQDHQPRLAQARAQLAAASARLDQISRFVQIGSRAPIDLTFARRDLADARVQWIRAQGDEAIAKARLVQATGTERSTSFQVASGMLAPIAGEDAPFDQLISEALEKRPDVLALGQQRTAQDATLRVQQQASLPLLKANAGVDAGGRAPTGIPAGTSLGLSLSWPLWNGGGTQAQVKEAEASLAQTDARIQLLHLQVRQELAQARQAVLTSREALGAAAESTRAAREQLLLAEGRYEAGVGSIIELSDAQLGLVRSRGQEAQQAQQLSTARAQLLKALGRA